MVVYHQGTSGISVTLTMLCLLGMNVIYMYPMLERMETKPLTKTEQSRQGSTGLEFVQENASISTDGMQFVMSQWRHDMILLSRLLGKLSENRASEFSQ